MHPISNGYTRVLHSVGNRRIDTMPCVQLKTEEKFKEFIKCGKLVIVDFKADWCPPCLHIAQIYEDMSDDQEFADVIFGIVDVDEKGTAGLAIQERIRSMPTFIIYKDGVMVKKASGADENNVRKILREAQMVTNNNKS